MLQNTLKIISTTLILISFSINAKPLENEIDACTQAANQGNGELALTRAEAILKLDHKNRDGMLCKGRALGLQGKHADALSAMQQALAWSGDQYEQIIAHMTIGNLHKEFNKTNDAMASYQQALALSSGDGYKRYARVSHNLMAGLYEKNKDYTAALASYQTGAGFANNDNERADSFERIAATHAALAQYTQAAEYGLKGLMMQQKAGTLDQVANDYVQLAQYYTQAKDYPSADNTSNKLLKFAQENGGTYYEAKANLLLAQSKFAANDAASAKQKLASAQAIAAKLNDAELNAEVEQTAQLLSK